MFRISQREDNILAASEQAKKHLLSWESLLELRISLQRPLDLANKIPLLSDRALTQDNNLLSQDLLDLASSLQGILAIQNKAESVQSSKKKPSKNTTELNSESLWTQIKETQDRLLSDKWRPILERVEANAKFGSEKAKAKLKVFNSSLWDQVDTLLANSNKVIEKSRAPAEFSSRIDLKQVAKDREAIEELSPEQAESLGVIDIHPEEMAEEVDHIDDSRTNKKKRKRYDAEVYDDTSFYSILLKVFLSSSTSSESSSRIIGNDTLDRLKRERRKNRDTERKASKGRKIRYIVHSKLQNFMFPVPVAAKVLLEPDRLFASLFQ